jgi:hypothetical protein
LRAAAVGEEGGGEGAHFGLELGVGRLLESLVRGLVVVGDGVARTVFLKEWSCSRVEGDGLSREIGRVRCTELLLRWFASLVVKDDDVCTSLCVTSVRRETRSHQVKACGVTQNLPGPVTSQIRKNGLRGTIAYRRQRSHMCFSVQLHLLRWPYLSGKHSYVKTQSSEFSRLDADITLQWFSQSRW